MNECTCGRRYDPFNDTSLVSTNQTCPQHGSQGRVICCICFEDFARDELWRDPDGTLVDVCHACGHLNEWLAQHKDEYPDNISCLRAYGELYGTS